MTKEGMDYVAQLKTLPRKHEFFIGIDSDGCVFDSMEIKHKEWNQGGGPNVFDRRRLVALHGLDRSRGPVLAVVRREGEAERGLTMHKSERRWLYLLIGVFVVFNAVTLSPLAAQRPDRARVEAVTDSVVAAALATGQAAGMTVAVVRGRDTLVLKGYGAADLELGSGYIVISSARGEAARADEALAAVADQQRARDVSGRRSAQEHREIGEFARLQSSDLLLQAEDL